MRYVVVERTDPHRCCARCGIEPSDVRNVGKKCFSYGVEYKEHFWIWWEPYLTQGVLAI